MRGNRNGSIVLPIVALVLLAIAQVLIYPDSGINPGLVGGFALVSIMLLTGRRRAR